MFGFAVIVNAYKTSLENTLHALKCRFKAALISVFCCLGQNHTEEAVTQPYCSFNR